MGNMFMFGPMLLFRVGEKLFRRCGKINELAADSVGKNEYSCYCSDIVGKILNLNSTRTNFNLRSLPPLSLRMTAVFLLSYSLYHHS